MTDSYTAPSGQTLRLINNRILVRGHAIAEMSEGGIHYPGKAVENVYRSGEILAIGYDRIGDGTKRPLADLEVGLNCLFIRYLAEQHSNLVVRDAFGDDTFLIGPKDILLLWPPHETPDLG